MPTVTAIQNNLQLSFIHESNYESRGISTEVLIRQALEKYKITKDFKLTVWTCDTYNPQHFSVCVSPDAYNRGFPCFVFDKWVETGFEDYTNSITSFKNTTPLTNKVGWIGAITCNTRDNFLNNYSNTYFSEGILNNWNRSDPSNLANQTPTYLTYQDQIDRWKYLLDIEGGGYSARTKVLLNGPRIVFIVDRPHHEWWYEHIKPWVHYVPVNRDLSDFEENYNKIESDFTLQEFIKQEQQKFAKEYLSRDAALMRIRDIITTI
jgi:hypothetical protein